MGKGKDFEKLLDPALVSYLLSQYISWIRNRRTAGDALIVLELPHRILSHSPTLPLPGAFAAILNLPLWLPVTKSQKHDGKLHMEMETSVHFDAIHQSPMEREHEVIISSCHPQYI